MVDQVKQPVTRNAEQDCKTKVTGTAEACTAVSDCLLEDSFEWTEDDMDELVLTCQLSSSGKGSLTVPKTSKPQFGTSPSQVSFVPETQFTQICSRASHAETQKQADASSPSQCTQILFPEEEDKKLYIDEGGDEALNANEVRQFQHAQQIPEQEDADQWELSFDDDDSLLASAMHEYELSREGIAKSEDNENVNNGKNGSPKIEEPPKSDDLVTSHLTKRFNFTERKVNSCQTESTNSSSSKELVKNGLSKTITSSHLTINSKFDTKIQKTSPPTTSDSTTKRTSDRDVRRLDKMAVKQSKSNNLFGKRNFADIAKNPGNSEMKVSEKPLNRMPTAQTNSRSMLEKDFCTKQVNESNKTEYVSSGNMATPLGRDRANTPCGIGSTSLENAAHANKSRYLRNNARTHLRDNVQSRPLPLQSLPELRPQENSKFSKEKPASRIKQTTTNNSTREFLSKTESKSSLVLPSKAQNSSEMQKNEKQENEFDFLMSEDDFTALLDDFNFDGEL